MNTLPNDLLVRCLQATFLLDTGISPTELLNPTHLSNSWKVSGFARAACTCRHWALTATELASKSPEWRSSLISLRDLPVQSNLSVAQFVQAILSPELKLRSAPQLATLFFNSSTNIHRLWPWESARGDPAQITHEVRTALHAVVPPATPVVIVVGEGVIGPMNQLQRSSSTPRISELQAEPGMVASTMRFPGCAAVPFEIAYNHQNSTLELPQHVFGSVDITFHESKAKYSVLGVQQWSSFVLLPSHGLLEQVGDHVVEQVCRLLHSNYPDAQVVGGICQQAWISTGAGSQQSNPADQDHRLIGVAFGAKANIDCVSSRGCQPVSPRFRVSSVPGHTYDEPSDRWLTFLSAVCPSESKVEVPMSQILQEVECDCLGVATEEMPADGYTLAQAYQPDSGLLVVSAKQKLLPGHFIQLYRLCPEASKADIEGRMQALGLAKSQLGVGRAVGAMLFACAGRGEGFYQEPNIDSGAFSLGFPQVPLVGFFAGGELGPLARMAMAPGCVTEQPRCSEVQSFTSVFHIVSFGKHWNTAEVFGENTDLEEAMARFMCARVALELPPGQRVTVVGLQAASEHNNQVGSVVEWLADRDRYQVKLDNGSLLAVRRGNLKTPY